MKNPKRLRKDERNMIRITHINFTDMDALSGARVVIEYISDSGVTQEMSAKLGDVHQNAMDKVYVGAEFESVFDLARLMISGKDE